MDEFEAAPAPRRPAFYFPVFQTIHLILIGIVVYYLTGLKTRGCACATAAGVYRALVLAAWVFFLAHLILLLASAAAGYSVYQTPDGEFRVFPLAAGLGLTAVFFGFVVYYLLGLKAAGAAGACKCREAPYRLERVAEIYAVAMIVLSLAGLMALALYSRI